LIFGIFEEMTLPSIQIRPYQKEGIDKIFAAWQAGTQSVLFQMPTGTGKTVLFAEIVRRGFKKERKILIVVHRKELVEQIAENLLRVGVPAGIIMAGIPPSPHQLVQIASIQTLGRREQTFQPHLVIIDESHHAKASSYKRLWENFPEAKFLGVTATPIRMSGDGFDDIFDLLITSMPVREFIAQGHLAPVRHFVSYLPNLIHVRKRNGDYMSEEISELMQEQVVMASLTDAYQKYAPGKKTIVFAVDVAHSKSIVANYQAAGIAAAHVDAGTPRLERSRLLEQFRRGEIQVMSNVEIITEGFDFPACEAVQLARPTKSLALYLQMVGRVMRPSPGKEFGLILDNAGLWNDHGLATEPRDWRLQGRKKQRDKPKEFLIQNGQGGYEFVGRIIPGEVKDIELLEVTEGRRRMVEFEEILAQVVYAIRHPRGEYAPKLLKAFFDYFKLLADKGIFMSDEEFQYVQTRLAKVKAAGGLPEASLFKEGFWWHQREARALFQSGKIGFPEFVARAAPPKG
jgi:superfamily II DNA or RNA helicase